MRNVTGEEVKEAVLIADINHIENHSCSLCGEMTYYFVAGKELYFNSACDCSAYSKIAPPRPCSWQEVADWINMQSKPESKISIAKQFGMEEEDYA